MRNFNCFNLTLNFANIIWQRWPWRTRSIKFQFRTSVHRYSILDCKCFRAFSRHCFTRWRDRCTNFPIHFSHLANSANLTWTRISLIWHSTSVPNQISACPPVDDLQNKVGSIPLIFFYTHAPSLRKIVVYILAPEDEKLSFVSVRWRCMYPILKTHNLKVSTNQLKWRSM